MSSVLSLRCPWCRNVFNIKGEVLSQGDTDVVMRLDRQEAVAHLRTCEAKKAALGSGMHQPIDQPVDPPEPVRPSEADLAGRIGQMFNTGAYIATGGSRACTMCGVNGKACMAELTKTRVSCCGACMGGNTHPSPKENAGSCREWAESEGLM